MSYTVAPLARLVEQLERLPSIGHKSAQRLAYYLLNVSDAAAADFVHAINDCLLYTSFAPWCGRRRFTPTIVFAPNLVALHC